MKLYNIIEIKFTIRSRSCLVKKKFGTSDAFGKYFHSVDWAPPPLTLTYPSYLLLQGTTSNPIPIPSSNSNSPQAERRKPHHFCVIPAGSSTAQEVQLVALEFPTEWQPPAYYNNHSLYAETACQLAMQWLTDRKLVPSPSDPNYKYWQAKVSAMNVKSYGGCSLPLGNFNFSLLNTKMTLIWLVWDDMVVEVSPTTAAEDDHQQRHFRNISEIMHGVHVRTRISIKNKKLEMRNF